MNVSNLLSLTYSDSGMQYLRNLTLLGLISSVYCDLHHWRSNQRPQIAISPYQIIETFSKFYKYVYQVW